MDSAGKSPQEKQTIVDEIRLTAPQNRQLTTVVDRLEAFRAAALALTRDFSGIGTEQEHQEPISRLADGVRDLLRPLDKELENLLHLAGRIENHVSEVTREEWEADRDEYGREELEAEMLAELEGDNPDDKPKPPPVAPSEPDALPDFAGLNPLTASLK